MKLALRIGFYLVLIYTVTIGATLIWFSLREPRGITCSTVEIDVADEASLIEALRHVGPHVYMEHFDPSCFTKHAIRITVGGKLLLDLHAETAAEAARPL